MIALRQEQYPHVRSPHNGGSVPAVVELSDKSEKASQIKAGQARRLRWLREHMGLQQNDAADLAGVTRFSWYRMEKGKSLIDTVALARFLALKGYSADYVVNGRTSGLPEDLAHDLRTLERAWASRAPVSGTGCTGADPATAPSGRKPRKSRVGTDS